MDDAAAEPVPLLTRHWGRALLVASVTAWTIVVLSVVAPAFSQDQANPYSMQSLFSVVQLLAIFGLPVAFVATFAAGVVALLLADMLKMGRWWHAPIVGGFAGLLIGVALALLFNSSGDAFGHIPLWTLIGAVSGLAGSAVIGTKAVRP